MKKPLVALVLAGGIGKRFWPIKTNKLLLPFLDKPLIYWTVQSILPKEVDRIVVVGNPDNASDLKSINWTKPCTIVIQKEARGMADAILSAKSELEGVSILLLIADHLVDGKLLSEIISRSKDDSVFAVIGGMQVNSYQPMGYFKLDGDKVVSIVEKPGAGNEPSNLVNISGHYISDADVLISEIMHTTSQNDDIYEQALSKLMKHTNFIVNKYQGRSVALKYPWHVLDMMDNLLDVDLNTYRGENIFTGNGVIIEGKVSIGNNVKIFENTKITGPCHISDNVIIGNNCIIRRSYIGENCVIGFGTDIARSYIGRDCWFHSNYIGDSVLESNISMGAGTVLANLRLDEGIIKSRLGSDKVNTDRNKFGAVIGKNVRIGVNASIMPGIKIGAESFIGGGLVVDKDIFDGSFAVLKSQIEIINNSRTNISPSRDDFRKKI